MNKTVVSLCASLVALAAPATAQNAAAATTNVQTAAAAQPKAKPAPAAEPKICKRIAEGRVCMTEKRWKDYENAM